MLSVGMVWVSNAASNTRKPAKHGIAVWIQSEDRNGNFSTWRTVNSEERAAIRYKGTLYGILGLVPREDKLGRSLDLIGQGVVQLTEQ